jgi:hypothetical protein
MVARRALGQLREPFLRGRLPSQGFLIIRHRLAVPHGFEAPWVLARSWPAPGQLLGRCLNDTAHPSLAHIRMGRLVVVEIDHVIDWAVVDAYGSVLDGGWSQAVRWEPLAPAPRVGDPPIVVGHTVNPRAGRTGSPSPDN